MEEKDFVTYEVAQMLKKHKYDGDYSHVYLDEQIADYACGDMFRRDEVRGVKAIPCPLLYEVQKWLREKHNLNVMVDYDESQLWGWSIHECNNSDDYIDNCSMFNSYEEALNEGIKEALEFI